MNAPHNILTSSNRMELNKAICEKILANRTQAFDLAIAYIKQVGGSPAHLVGLADGLDAIPDLYGYELDISEFEYSGIEPFYDPKMVSERRFENNGSTTIENTFSFEENTTDTFSYGFTQSLMVGATVSGKVNLPVVAGGEVSLTSSITLGSNQQWTETKTRTWKDMVKVPVPPHSNVVVRGFITTATMDGTFTAKLRPNGGKTQTCFKTNIPSDKGGYNYEDIIIPLSVYWNTHDALEVTGHFSGGEGVGIRTMVDPATPYS